jgi:hypothetical protein
VSTNEALHNYHSRLDDSLRHDGESRFAEMVFDVTDGLGLCLELLAEDSLRHDNHEPPILGVNDTGRMQRFAAASARMLHLLAEERIELLNDRAERESANAVAP